jgi:hypothetical protein
MAAADAACYALVDRAECEGCERDEDGYLMVRDTVQALVWLHQCVAETEAKADAMGVLQARLTEQEWPTWLVWREGTSRRYVAVMARKHGVVLPVDTDESIKAAA